MKLLRLSGNNADFEANFNENIEIPKNSKICLKNVSFKRIYEVLKFVPNDKTFLFTMNGEANITFNMTERTYTNKNYQEALEELDIRLNKHITMTNNGSFVGLQAKHRITNSKQVRIDFRKTPTYLEASYVNKVVSSLNVTMNRQKRIIKVDGNDPSIDTEIPDRIFFSDDIQFTKGAGVLSCKIGNLVDNGANNHTGFYMGLSTAPNGSGEVLYNIEIRRPTDPFTAISNGIVVNGITLQPQNFTSNLALSLSDIIEITKDTGFISGFVRQVQGFTRIFHHPLSDEDQLKPLYPVFGVYGSSAHTKISLVRMNIDPFEVLRPIGNIGTNYLNTNIASVLNSVQIPPQLSLNAIMPLSFENFINIETFIDVDATFWRFQGVESFNLNLEDENYVVELLNLEVESFDSTRQKRMNILATIPSENTTTGILNYDVNERVCVSLSNTFDLQLRNLRARVLDKNLDPIITENNAIMTILIE